MNKVASFNVDHDKLKKGMYISRIDGDVVTYDIRMKKPNMGDYLSNGTVHTFEHLLAACLRNGPLADAVIYIGPMGCRTGFCVLLRDTVSNADAIDLDGDGEREIAAIEPFHGCYFRIYKKIGGAYRMVYEFPEVSEFYHVVKAGYLLGRPCFLGGCRRGKKQLFAVYWDKETKSFVTETVDEGVGPSNACIRNGRDGDVIYSANREAAQAAAYFVRE